MTTELIQSVQNADEYTMETLDIEDPLVGEAMVERLAENTVITITVFASDVTQDYNPPNRDSSTREPESFAELFGVSRHAHDELVEMFTGVNNFSSNSARSFLKENLTLEKQRGDQLHFTVKI